MRRASLKSQPKRLIPIVRSSDLWLARTGYGNERKFVSAFQAAWSQIPYCDRRDLVKHWRTDSMRFFGVQRPGDLTGGPSDFVSPYIRLLEGWNFDREYVPTTVEHHRGEYAFVNCEGHRMLFWSARFDLMPTDVAASVIAHELAHVAQWAWGYELLFGTNEPCAQDCEQHADELMGCRWDFDPELVDRWGVEMRFCKKVECADIAEWDKRMHEKGGRYYDEPKRGRKPSRI